MPRFEQVPVVSIELDIKNPRIAKYIEYYGDNITAEQMALAVGQGSSDEEGRGGPSFSALKQSILTNGGIIHPIIVNRQPGDKYVAIEGNTRLLIYKDFKQNNQEGQWDAIPAMVYEDMSEELIDSIRLQAHLVGPREWDPYSKAKYLEQLRNKQHLPFAQIVDYCGGNQKEIEKYIQAYLDMEQYYRPILESDSDFDASRFSAFFELQQRRIAEAVINAGFSKKDFSTWVHNNKLYPLVTVRSLPRILQNPRSKEVFLRRGAREAEKILDVATPQTAMNEATLEQLLREVCKRIASLEYSYIQQLKREKESEEKSLICEAKDNLNELCKDILAE